MNAYRIPISINGSRTGVYSHCLFPKCEINAPPYPLSRLALSQVDLIMGIASSTGVGPLKYGAYAESLPRNPSKPWICSGVAVGLH